MFRVLNVVLLFAVCGCLTAKETYQHVGLPLVTIHSQNDYRAHQQNWCIQQGQDHLIYVCNGNGLLVWDGENWHPHYTPNRSRIRAMSWWQGALYVGTNNDLGTYVISPNGVLAYHSLLPAGFDKQFGEVYSVAATPDFVAFKTFQGVLFWNGQNVTVLNDVVGNSYLVESEGQLYFKPKDDANILRLSPEGVTQTNWQLPAKTGLRNIIKIGDERYFLTDRNGLYKVQKDQLVFIANPFPDRAYIYNVTQSSDGFLYFASVSHGLIITDLSFNVLRIMNNDSGIETGIVTQVAEDHQGNVWVAGVGKIIQMPPAHQFSRIESDDQSKLGEHMLFVEEDLYVLGFGVFKLSQENQIPKLQKNPFFDGNFWDLRPLTNGQYMLSGSQGVQLVELTKSGDLRPKQRILEVLYAYQTVVDSETQQVYASTSQGLFVIKQTGDHWVSEQVEGISSEVGTMVLGDDRDLWVGATAGELFHIKLGSAEKPPSLLKHFTTADGIGNNKTVPFKILGGVYIGTHNGLMQYQKNSGSLEFVEGFPELFTTANQDVHLVVAENEQKLWYRIGGHSGVLSKTNHKWQLDESLFKVMPPRSINAFLAKGSVVWVYFAGNGLYRLDRKYIQGIPPPGQLLVRAIDNVNTQVTDYQGHGMISELIFPHDQSSLRVSYALTDYALPGKSLYRTRLLGSADDSWSDWSRETYKDLTQLKHAEYQFQIQAQDGWQRVTEPVGVSFDITAPWYLSQLAWLLYIILFGLMTLITAKAYAAYRVRKLRHANLLLDQKVKQKTRSIHIKAMELELLQKAKDRFMTDFSHELRTPLSLIMAPIEQVNDIQPHHMLNVALNNAEKLKTQINRIFDLQHLSEPVIELKKEPHCLQAIIKAQVVAFQVWAKKHQQKLIFTGVLEPSENLLDKGKVEAVISNLISNAIKYAGTGAHIEIRLEQVAEEFRIDVIDDGPGVQIKDFDQVFQRFVTDDSHNISRYPGVGVGLAYAKEISQFHGGNLQLLESTHGAHFRCILPIIESPAEITHVNLNETLDPISEDDHPVLMVVEDNDELREVLVKILSEAFVVYEFSSADTAMQQMEGVLPDAIISDVMMPGTDGVAFTQAIRKIKTLQTTPVILLTAKAAQNDIQKGLEAGATDYMVKPFSPRELFLRVTNHIQTIHAIRKQLQPTSSSEKVLSPFLEQLNQVILGAIREGKLSTAQLASKMAMDRTTLFRKIKKETDRSPSQYLMDFRLNTAKQLLKKHHHSISETAYASGFDSLSYFSTCFKKHYNKTPSEYIESFGCNQN